MRIRRVAIVGASTLVVAGCGSVGGRSPTVASPATPVNLTVYVNNQRVSVSPSSVGAGPVTFIVTNQADTSEALTISRSGQGGSLASTAPINPQGTTQVSVNFSPGDYTIATASHGSTDAQLSQPSSIQSASIHIGGARASSDNQLLEP